MKQPSHHDTPQNTLAPKRIINDWTTTMQRPYSQCTNPGKMEEKDSSKRKYSLTNDDENDTENSTHGILQIEQGLATRSYHPGMTKSPAQRTDSKAY